MNKRERREAEVNNLVYARIKKKRTFVKKNPLEILTEATSPPNEGEKL